MTALSTTTLRAIAVHVIDPPRELWKRLVNRVRSVRDISPHVADALIRERDAFVLDVREQHEYDAGHLAYSTLIPLGSLATRVAELEPHRTRPIVVICHGGKRSATACWQLARLGYADTYNIAGGILAWKRAALPLAD